MQLPQSKLTDSFLRLPLSLRLGEILYQRTLSEKWNLDPVTRSKFPLSMSQAVSSLGACPFCEIPVPRNAILIEYVVNNEERVYAECPKCKEPVQPQ